MTMTMKLSHCQTHHRKILEPWHHPVSHFRLPLQPANPSPYVASLTGKIAMSQLLNFVLHGWGGKVNYTPAFAARIAASLKSPVFFLTSLSFFLASFCAFNLASASRFSSDTLCSKRILLLYCSVVPDLKVHNASLCTHTHTHTYTHAHLTWTDALTCSTFWYSSHWNASRVSHNDPDKCELSTRRNFPSASESAHWTFPQLLPIWQDFCMDLLHSLPSVGLYPCPGRSTPVKHNHGYVYELKSKIIILHSVHMERHFSICKHGLTNKQISPGKQQPIHSFFSQMKLQIPPLHPHTNLCTILSFKCTQFQYGNFYVAKAIPT